MAKEDEFIKQCAWCERVRIGDKWIPHKGKIKEASHGICERCADKVYEEMGWARSNPRKKRAMKNPAKRPHTLELVRLNGTQVMTGKKVEMIFLVKRRSGERLIDAIINNFNLGGLHVHKVTKMRLHKKVMLVSATEK